MVDYFAEYGVELSHQDALARFSGKDLKLVIAELAPLMDRAVPDDFIPEFRRRQTDALTRRLRPMDGADDMLGSMRHPFCVASNAPLTKMRVCLETTGLIRHFDESRLFSAYQVNAWKPSPDVFLMAARQMGVHPHECLVVEDSIFGIDAGFNAGMKVVAFDPSNHLTQSFDDQPDLVRKVQHLSEVSEMLSN